MVERDFPHTAHAPHSEVIAVLDAAAARAAGMDPISIAGRSS